MNLLLDYNIEKKQKKVVDFTKIQEAKILIDFIETRFRKGLGTTVFVIGLSGTGKSSSCQRIGELVKERRNDAELFITDSLLTLLDAIRKSKVGDIIICEEISVLFPSRRAMSRDNVSINRIMDTLRKKQIVLLTNAPIWNTIDSHMKSMGHVVIQTQKVLKKQRVVCSKFHILQVNPLSGKPYFHTFLNERKRDVNLLITRMPNLERWNKYEEQKDKFVDKLYQRIQHITKKQEDKLDKELGVKNTNLENLEPLHKQILYLKQVEGLRQQEIAKKVGVSQPRVSQIIKEINKMQENTKEDNQK